MEVRGKLRRRSVQDHLSDRVENSRIGSQGGPKAKCTCAAYGDGGIHLE